MRAELFHQLLIDVQPPGSIQDQDVVAVVSGLHHRPAGDLHRIPCPISNTGTPACSPTILSCSMAAGAVDITGGQQRPLAAGLEIPGQLAQWVVLPAPEGPAHHDDGRILRGEVDAGVGRAHQLGELVVDDLDDLLGRSETFRTSLPRAFSLTEATKSLVTL